MLASELKLGPALTVFLSRTAAGTDALVGLLIWPEVGGVVPGGGGSAWKVWPWPGWEVKSSMAASTFLI